MRIDNPGLTKATATAKAVNGLLAVPVFPEGANGTDFNDLASLSGLEEVRRQIQAATTAETGKVDEESTTFQDLLSTAKKLTADDIDKIEALVKVANKLGAIQKRRLLDEIKKATGLPFSVLQETARSDTSNQAKDDLSLAKALIQEIGRENILAAQSFVWRWEGSVWRPQEDRGVKQLVQKYISDKVDAVGRCRVESITDLLTTEVFRQGHQFDVGPVECVNTPSGEVTLVDTICCWIIRPHNREHYRTTQIPVAYDPEAKAPRFEQFLEEIFRGDPDAADKAKSILEMIGYTLMAHCRHERFIILVGGGENGKSVLLAVVEALCGPENVAAVQPSMFDRSFQRAHLHRKLANIVTEIRQGEIINDASLKSIVSGEPTSAELKFRDPFVMRPFSTCWFGTNHMPNTRDFSKALFRRALVVEFNQSFNRELNNCDPELRDKLFLELPGILNMALEAYADALLNGFTRPASCLSALEQWRLETDQVAQFVDEACERSQHEIPFGEVFRAYEKWALKNGDHNRLGSKSFRDRLTRLGFGHKRTNATRLVTGISLNSEFGSW